MAEKLIGQDIAPDDLHAKITGRAKYAEDFRADGMVFAKLLPSPMPHCRVLNVDASAALAGPVADGRHRCRGRGGGRARVVAR